MNDIPVPGDRRKPTAPADVLDGDLVGADNTAYCCTCRNELRSGDAATAYAYRLVDSATWDVARLYCLDCTSGRIRGPTLGALEVLVTTRLRTCSLSNGHPGRLAISSPTVCRYSAPGEGAAP